MKRTRWTQAEVKDFIEWHESLLKTNKYGEAVVKSLRRARNNFIAAVAAKESV